jgi:hypothetical protein
VRNLTIDWLSKKVEDTITDMVIVSIDEPLPSICSGHLIASTNGRFTVSQTAGGWRGYEVSLEQEQGDVH